MLNLRRCHAVLSKPLACRGTPHPPCIAGQKDEAGVQYALAAGEPRMANNAENRAAIAGARAASSRSWRSLGRALRCRSSGRRVRWGTSQSTTPRTGPFFSSTHRTSRGRVASWTSLELDRATHKRAPQGAKPHLHLRIRSCDGQRYQLPHNILTGMLHT